MKIVSLPISKITVAAGLNLERGDVHSLAASIAKDGLHQPITVRSDGQLLSGERRLRASRDVLNWSEIPAVVNDDLSREEATWIENLHREDLLPSQKTELAERLIAAKKLTAQEAADVLGMNRRDLFRCFKVTRLDDPELTALMDSGEISQDHAAAIAEQPEEKRWEILALPAEERREAVRALSKTSKSRPQHGPSFKRLTRQMNNSWGAQVDDIDESSIEASCHADCAAVREAMVQFIAKLQAKVAAIDAAPKPPKRKRRKRKPPREPRCKLKMSEESLNKRWEGLSAVQRQNCRRKVEVAEAAQGLHERDGVPLKQACESAAAGTEWKGATIYHWITGRGEAGLDLYPRHLWPLVLAPKYIGGGREADCDPAAWESFKTDYLRLEKPTAEQCFRNLQRLAEQEGWQIPRSAKSLVNRIRREIHPDAIVLAREGAEALSKRRPPQIRERPQRAMEAVNADGHVVDVFVRWPDAKKPERPTLVAWQDIHSGKILSWRLDRTENADGYRLSFADLLRKYGIPQHVFLDNSRASAAKGLTGGKDKRFRFKVKRDDPVGLLTQLVGQKNIHWTTPYHGQSKPIERAFRDLATDIAKDHRLRGAYTGPNPQEKPANYDEKKGVPLDKFLAVLKDGIARHNARHGRRGLGMDGRSFDEVFKQSYEQHADSIARPTEAQLTRWLLGAEGVTAHKDSGAVTLFGTRYFSERLVEKLAGRSAAKRKVVVRFDPDNLTLPVVVETLDGVFLAKADPQGAVKHIDTRAARETARDQSRLRRHARKHLEISKSMSDREYEQLLDQVDAETRDAEETPVRLKVMAGAFGREQKQAKPASVAARTGTDNLIRKMAARAFPRVDDAEESPLAATATDDFLIAVIDREIPSREDGDE